MSGPLKMKNCVLHFECSKNWYELKTTNEDSVRFCIECEKNVHIVDNLDTYRKAIEEGKCVAIFDSRVTPLMGKPADYNDYEGDDLDFYDN